MGSVIAPGLVCHYLPFVCSHRHAVDFVPALVGDTINITLSVGITLLILRSGLFDGTEPLPWVARFKGKEEKEEKKK
jgi:hypothetical protein